MSGYLKKNRILIYAALNHRIHFEILPGGTHQSNLKNKIKFVE